MQNKIWTALQRALIVGLFAFFVSCSGRLLHEEQEALDFLYAYMPLPDSVDYSRDFWEQNVVMAVRARHEMPWGEKVPEREWRHFVLPLRVNNEDLDSFRVAYYDELRERVKGMSMFQSVLEVNHWCHEHVSYQPSDSRTSSPISTLRSAIGRCGEESTFTVTALRTIGIPARQVYTPRWAHTDDNHAWVEAWVDGKWYFLGACEPEPVLNLGWFNESVSRGMHMHTKVFGAYNGSEEQLARSACYTEINVTRNYAEVGKVNVRVFGADSVPANDATVDYRLYNYAEFYPIASKLTDEEGRSALTCGKGDLLVWASKDGMFGFRKVSVTGDVRVDIYLDKDSTYTDSFDIDLMPPAPKYNRPEVSAESKLANKKRLAKEDSIRNAYMQEAFCRKCPEDSPEKLARANWHTIVDFRKNAPSEELAEQILASLSRKDYRDVTAAVLQDVARHTPASAHPYWRDYILSPRVANERLTPSRGALAARFGGMTPATLMQWVNDSVTIDDTRNPQHLCMSPLGVLHHRVADTHSRDIFFVAAARSIGIPARIDPVTAKVQWADASGLWQEARFGAETPHAVGQGTLLLTYTDQRIKQNPSYYTHFAISRIDAGRPQLQEYPETANWSDTFADGTSVAAGQYMLVSGTRMANGRVMAHLEFVGVQPDRQLCVPLRLRADEDQLRVIGSFNCELGFTNARGVHKPILQTTGRGFYVVGLIRSGHEPSTHLLHDMEAANIYLARWDRCYLLLFPSQEEYDNFNRKEFDSLPSNVLFGVADPETVEALHIQELTHGSQELPILMLADTFNRVVWFRQGYSIGLGDQMMAAIIKVILGE